MRSVYVDRLSPASVIALVARPEGRAAAVRYFSATPGGLRIARLAGAAGLLRGVPEPADFHLSDLRDDSGACRFFAIYEDLREIVKRIDAEHFARHPLLVAVEDVFPEARVRFLLRKALAEDLHETAAFVNAARWSAAVGEGALLFLLERSPWSPYVLEYSRSLGLEAAEYHSAGKAWRNRYTAAVASRFTRTPSGPTEPVSRPASATPTRSMPRASRPTIASWYTARSVTFDSSRRSDLFWTLDAPVSRDSLFVYFDRPSLPVTAADADVLAEQGVEPLAMTSSASLADGVRVHGSGAGFAKLKSQFRRRIVSAWFRSLLEGRPANVFISANLYYFATQYAYWYDFFEANGVKVSVSPYDFTRPYAAKNLAMEHLGGVSVSYQWSNLDFASIEMSTCSDAMFTFGPAYRWVYEANRSQIGRLISCGYITDHSFAATRERSAEMRARLKAAGAEFVLAYFDENSSDDRMQVISNERAASIYRDLLGHVLRDTAFGLILKPGYPRTLRDRLGEDVWDLLDRAVATGRCVLMDEGSYVTERYPAEAAQAADAAVGLLLSGTVALESHLAGTPTVFLDLESLNDRNVYRGGEGTVVFRSTERLLAALDSYRADKASVPAFGDLSDWAAGRDEFRDGRAAERLGGYVTTLHNAFVGGATRDQALAVADSAYAAAWGAGSVIPWQ